MAINNVNMNARPLISVVIPAYNNNNGLLKAVECALQQEGSFDLDVIIVDDFSNPPVKIQEHPQITLIRHKTNLGAASARNTGMAKAKGELIAFLDSDDWWESGKLQKQLTTLQGLPEKVAGVFTPFCYDGNTDAIYNQELTPKDWLSYFLMGCRVGPGSTLLFRKTMYEHIGPQDETLMRFEDWDWLLRCAEHYDFSHAEKALTVLGSPSRSTNQLIKDCIKDFETKWAKKLSGKNYYKLLATLNIEKAVIENRQGNRLKALYCAFFSLIQSPMTTFYNLRWRFF